MLNDDYGQRIHLTQKMKSGANWFYWIAGLSMITSILAVSGSGWRFFLSLGITQFIDGFAAALSNEVGTAGLVIGIVLNIFITAVFAGLGFLARKKHLWAFVVGMVLFALDALLLLLFLDIFAILFHGLAIYYIFRGFQAARDLVALEQAAAMQPPAPPQTAQAQSI
jgi:hypothetical protein